MAGERIVTMQSADALFKEYYGSNEQQTLVNVKTPLASVLMKNKKVDWVGDEFTQPVRFGSAVGLGYRNAGENLPAPGAAPRGKARLTAKRAYATVAFDREAIKASRNDRGAFAKVTVDEVEAAEEGFMLHQIERALFGDGSGKLAQVSSIASGTGTENDPYVVVFSSVTTAAPKFKKKYFPEGARIDFFTTGGLYQCTLKVVFSAPDGVRFVLLSSGAVSQPGTGDFAYWEGNKDKEIVGMQNLAASTPGTLYNINQVSRPIFNGTVKTISGALDYTDVNDIVSEVEEEIDSPNLAVGSSKALAMLKNQAENRKQYNMAEVKSSDAKIGFKGLSIMSESGEFPMIASSMAPDDEILFLNTKYLQLIMREDFGWFDDDGTILMRDGNKDILNARYGGYFELFCSKPNSIARVKGFSL